MQLTQAIAQLTENEARHARELETGFHTSGNPLPEKMIPKRQESLRRVRERLAIAQRWAKQRPRPDAYFTQAEQEFITEYELDDLFAVVRG